MMIGTVLAALAAPATAGSWEVGVGIRNSAIEDGDVEGVRGIVRQRRGAWALEGQVYWSPETERIPSFYETIIQIAEDYIVPSEHPFQMEVEVDRATAALLGEWSVAEPESDAPWWGGGPRLYAGAEARQQHVYTLVADGESRAGGFDTRWVFGPTIGAGWQLDLGTRLGLRGAVYDRMLIAPPLQYNPDAAPPEGLEIRHYATTALDLLVRF